MNTQDALAQLRDRRQPFLSDGGLETWMVFVEGLDLPHFASITLLGHDAGREALSRYFGTFARIARDAGAGLLLDTLTWRASPDWAGPLGLDAEGLDRVNRAAVRFAIETRAAHQDPTLPILVNGVIGPRGDGYAPGSMMSADEAAAYHAPQARWLAEAGVDTISGLTITHTGEGIGIARAARAAGKPVVISYTVEIDGRLPSGEPLAEAIRATDAATGGAPLFYMVNCAHPSHFRDVLDGDWLGRVGGVRANASRLSHAELDAAETLDAGDPVALADDYAGLQALLPGLRVFGGCCGTDHRHVGAIAGRCLHHRAAA